MNDKGKKITGDLPWLLIAEDDDDNYLFVSKALEKSRLKCKYERVCDGEELLNFLNQNADKMSRDEMERFPDIIFLDLNMPKVDGREALRAIKKDPRFSHIPVIIFTVSRSPEDMWEAYKQGANSFVSKPSTFEGTKEFLNIIYQYWFNVVSLPGYGH